MQTEPPKTNHLQPGMQLSGGKYTIEKKIGEGGFSITYRAMQSGLNRAVCIKEYFPAGHSMRDTAHYTVQPPDDHGLHQLTHGPAAQVGKLIILAL